MIDRIKYTAKVSSVGLISFIKLSLLGNLSAILSFVVGLVIVLLTIRTGASHIDGRAIGIVILLTAPVQSILLVLILLSSIFIVSFSGSYAVQKVITKIVNDKSEAYLHPIIDKMLLKFNPSNQLLEVSTENDQSRVKQKLLESVKEVSENKWGKKIVHFGLKRLNLDDIDFNDKNVDQNEIIKLKIVAELKETIEPSLIPLWLVIAFHWIAVITIYFMK